MVFGVLLINDNRDNRARRSRRDHEAAFHQVDNSNRQHTPPSSPAYTRIRRPVQANAIAGPSMQPRNEENRSLQGDPGASVPTPSQMEVELLIGIANGTGLSHYDTLGGVSLKCVLSVVIIFFAVFLVLM